MEENNVQIVQVQEPKKNNGGKIAVVVILLILLVVVIGVGILFLPKILGGEESTEVKNKEYSSKYAMTGNELQDFDISFLSLENKSKNIVYSPLSIKYALLMLSEGSNGDSKGQIDAVIGKYEARKYNNNQNMSFANAMFIRNSLKDIIKSDYTKNLKDKYNAEIIYDEFASVDNLNQWSSEKTFKMIDNVLDDVTDMKFVLLNALAIDMEWNQKIQVDSSTYKNIYNVRFNHEDYVASIVPIMGDSYGKIRFNDSMDAKAVEIGASVNKYDIVKDLGEENIRKTISDEYTEYLAGPYVMDSDERDVNKFVDGFIEELKENYGQIHTSTDFKFYVGDDYKVFSKELKEYDRTRLEYVAIMPQKESLDNFIKNSNAEEINEIISKRIGFDDANEFKDGVITKITGGIPVFKYNYELNFEDDLKKLGIKDIFDPKKVDISGIIDDKNTFIGKAVHKATIDFSNDGIKASAVSALGGLGAARGGFDHLFDVPIEIIDVTFDKPYIYFIRDTKTGEVWFTGQVYEPTVSTNADAYVINKK